MGRSPPGRVWLGAAVLALAPVDARAEENRPLLITVRPSGFEAVETLDEKIARRDALFRSICRGCGRYGALDDAGEGSFWPQRSLDARRAP